MYQLFPLFILMFLAIVFVISYLVADEFYDVALAKGYESRKYFWLPFWLGLPGWLAACHCTAEQRHSRGEQLCTCQSE